MDNPLFHYLNHLTVILDEEERKRFEKINLIYFTATEAALESILRRGILPPDKVARLIRKGKLNRNVLGYSSNEEDVYNGCCPYWVSLELLADEESWFLYTPECLLRKKKKPAIFKINNKIKTHKTYPLFIPKFIIPLVEYGYGWNAVYRGIIAPKFIESYGLLKEGIKEDLESWSNIDSYQFTSLK